MSETYTNTVSVRRMQLSGQKSRSSIRGTRLQDQEAPN